MATFKYFFQSGRAKDLSARLYNIHSLFRTFKDTNNKVLYKLSKMLGRSSGVGFPQQNKEIKFISIYAR